MAKRFTDSEKWKKQTFGELSLKMKLVWIYLCDNCDHAGIWEPNLRLLAFQIGEPVTLNEIVVAFGDKLIVLPSSKIFIRSFIEFQYGELNPDNRAHSSVISRLKKEGAYKVLASPLQGAMDKDKDKDKENLKSEIVISDAQKLENRMTFDFKTLFALYAKPEKKAQSLKILEETISDQKTYDDMRKAIVNYHKRTTLECTEYKYILTFPSFIKQWRDWIDWVAPDSLKNAPLLNGKHQPKAISYMSAEDVIRGQQAQSAKLDAEAEPLTPEQTARAMEILKSLGVKTPDGVAS